MQGMLRNGFRLCRIDEGILIPLINPTRMREVRERWHSEDPGNELGIIQDGRGLHAMGYFRCGKNRP